MLLTDSDSGVLKYRARLRKTPLFIGGERVGLSEFNLIYLNGDRSHRPIAIHFPCFEFGDGLPDGGSTIEVIFYREGFRDEVIRQLGWQLGDDHGRVAA